MTRVVAQQGRERLEMGRIAEGGVSEEELEFTFLFLKSLPFTHRSTK